MIADEKEETNNWTEIITPAKSLFQLNLREIWRYRDLVMLLVNRDFVSQYKQTILGPLWFFIQPLFTTLMFLIVFSKVAKLSTDNIPPVLFYLAGITMWSYFADCLNKTANTFTTNATIFGKVYFPRLVVPISIVIASLIKFSIQFLLFILFLCYYRFFRSSNIHLNVSVLLLPYLMFLMGGLSLGAGIIFSSFTTKYRDLSILLQFGIQLLMYGTTVIFPLSGTSGKFRTLLLLNPMTIIIETFRYAFLGNGFFSGLYLLYSTFFMITLLFIGIVIFNQVEKSFMDTV